MQEVFGKIIGKLKNKHIPYIGLDNSVPYGTEMVKLFEAIEIVNQVAEEFSHKNHDLDIEASHSNDGWIPCSSGKMPENGRRCWVTYEWANGSLHVDKDYLVNGKWFETKDEAVKAWMYNDEEEPEPYQPKGEK